MAATERKPRSLLMIGVIVGGIILLLAAVAGNRTPDSPQSPSQAPRANEEKPGNDALARVLFVQQNVSAMPAAWHADGRLALVDLKLVNRTAHTISDIRLQCVFISSDLPAGYAVEQFVLGTLQPTSERIFLAVKFELPGDVATTKLKECQTLKAEIGPGPR